MIEAKNLTKKYGDKIAVDGMSFRVESGTITGFLGPNGAGKSTTMRMIVGLDRPTLGSVTVDGAAYAAHRTPLTSVGSLLDAHAVHPARSARDHLRALAATHDISVVRVDEVIEMTGLHEVANQRVGGYSLGMHQRLGIAAAMLADPQNLILDEPVNGLDPEGVLWVRRLLRYLADQGRTVFLSSHLMSEMAQTADNLIVIGRGRIITAGPTQDIIDSAEGASVRVRTDRAGELAAQLSQLSASISSDEAGTLDVKGVNSTQIGNIAAVAGIALQELTPVSASLEEAYMKLTSDAVEYRSDDALVGAAQEGRNS